MPALGGLAPVVRVVALQQDQLVWVGAMDRVAEVVDAEMVKADAVMDAEVVAVKGQDKLVATSMVNIGITTIIMVIIGEIDGVGAGVDSIHGMAHIRILGGTQASV